MHRIDRVIFSSFISLTLLLNFSITGCVKENSHFQSNKSPTLSSIYSTKTMASTARAESILVRLRGSNLSDFTKLPGQVSFGAKSRNKISTQFLDVSEISDDELSYRLHISSIVNKEATETVDLEISVVHENKTYLPDLRLAIVSEPVITSLTPRGSTTNGGNPVSVSGTNLQYLNFDQGVFMWATIGEKDFQGDKCELNKDNNSVMTCFTPECRKPCPLKDDNRLQRASVYFSGLVGNNRWRWPRSGSPNETSLGYLGYHHPPKFQDNYSQMVDYKDPVVDIKGENIYTDYTINVNIKVGDNFTCVTRSLLKMEIEEIPKTLISCQIKEDVSPDLLGKDIPVSVKVGKNDINIGTIIFYKSQHTKTIVLVMEISVTFLLTAIIIIGYVMWKKRKQKKQNITLATNGDSVICVTDDSERMERGVMWMNFMERNGVLRKLISSRKFIDNKFLTLGDKIGSGHFGEVFRGILKANREESESQERNEVEAMSVAVKCIRRQFWTRSEYEMFLKEALVMRELDHPHIINLIGISFESDGLPQVITPFMLNGDLLMYLRDQSSTHVRVIDLLVFGIEIASGMEYLSSKNIIHRDLAARNCLLDDSFHVKIGDFGLARATYDKGYYRSGEERMLPIKWIAIECLQGRITFTTESDVWSYGVCLWEIMSRGVEPYEGIDAQLLKQFLTQGKRLEKPEYCPEEVFEIMLRCWSAEPKERITFKEILTGIQNYMSSVKRRSWERNLSRVRSYVNFPAVFEHVRTNSSSSLIDVSVNYVTP